MWIDGQSFGVEFDRPLEVPIAAGLVAPSDFLHELGLAQKGAVGGPSLRAPGGKGKLWGGEWE